MSNEEYQRGGAVSYATTSRTTGLLSCTAPSTSTGLLSRNNLEARAVLGQAIIVSPCNSRRFQFNYETGIDCFIFCTAFFTLVVLL